MAGYKVNPNRLPVVLAYLGLATLLAYIISELLDLRLTIAVPLALFCVNQINNISENCSRKKSNSGHPAA